MIGTGGMRFGGKAAAFGVIDLSPAEQEAAARREDFATDEITWAEVIVV